jgi:hypothetical protein
MHRWSSARAGLSGLRIATKQILPQLVLSPGGLVTMVMTPVTGRLIGAAQPKYLIAAIAALSMWHLTGITGDITYGYAAMSRIYLAIGLPLLFLPITTASYDGVPPDKTNQASALINVARNLGGSMGVVCRRRRWRSASNSIRAAWSSTSRRPTSAISRPSMPGHGSVSARRSPWMPPPPKRSRSAAQKGGRARPE